MLNRRPLQAVLFDWDGTLLDSYQSDARAYVAMFAAMGIPWDLGDLTRHYSPDWYAVYRAALLPEDRWAEADRLWRRFYRDERPRLQPGARRVVERLARARPVARARSHFPLLDAHLRRRLAAQETASRTVAAGAATHGLPLCGVRLRGRYPGRRRHGAGCRSRRHRRHRTLPCSTKVARGAAR